MLLCILLADFIGYMTIHYYADGCLFLDINALTEDGETALHLAVKSGSCEIIEVLLAHGASGEVKDSKSFTPVHLAVQLGKHGALKVRDLIVLNISF